MIFSSASMTCASISSFSTSSVSCFEILDWVSAATRNSEKESEPRIRESMDTSLFMYMARSLDLNSS